MGAERTGGGRYNPPTGSMHINVLGQRTYYVGVRAADGAGNVSVTAWSPGQRVA